MQRIPDTMPLPCQFLRGIGGLMGREEIADLFAEFGTVTFRKMFGGTAIYVGSRIVGMEWNGAILIKGDATSRADLDGEGLVQWGYRHAKTGKEVLMPYWTLPDDALDDHDRVQRLVAMAWQAAQRGK